MDLHLLEATSKEDHDLVLRLIELGANVHTRNALKQTPLHLAAERGYYEIAKTLLEHGAQLNALDRTNQAPIHRACVYGRKQMVELLLHMGASLEIGDSANRKPVDFAKGNKYKDIVDMLEIDFPLWLRLYHASKQGNYVECEELLERGALVYSSQYGLYCPLAAASQEGHSEIVKLILEKETRMNYYRDGYKRRPLYLATKHGHKEIVSLLWDAERNANFKINGETLLHVATRNNNEGMVRLLIEKEVNPNIQDNEGCTSLHYAVLYGNHAIVTYLLNANANINLANNKMETPLHLACEGGYTDIVQLLLENGAKKDALNARNEKPVNVVDKKLIEKKLESIKELLTGSNGRFSDIESNEDSSGEDSDATVDFSNSTKTPVKLDFSCGTLNIADIEELNDKLAQLSSIILELNDSVMNAELIRADLGPVAETLKNFNRQIEHVKGLKRLKSKDTKAQTVYEDRIADLTRRMDESKKKESELREQIEKSQTEITLLKARVQRVYREIGRFIDKVKVAF